MTKQNDLPQIPDSLAADAATLDPVDWEALRAAGHRMLDDMLTLLQGVRDRPVWQPLPDDVASRLDQPLPHHGIGIEAAYEAFKRDVQPYPTGNIHPRFWGWVIGTGTPSAMLADMLASGLNPNVAGLRQAPVLVEQQVIRWCAQMLGLPVETSGLLVSGASMANLLALAVARHAHFERTGVNVREDGVADGAVHTVYGSSELHSCHQRSVELLGLGNRNLRRVAVDDAYRVDTQALRVALRDDLDRGIRPMALIGAAGTANTGALDSLDALADVAEEFGVWFHVDGAFGALASLSEALRDRVAGLERADSVAFDLHKWMGLPYGVGCVLIRDAAVHQRTFTLIPEYLKHAKRGVTAQEWWPSEYGIELSRGFLALKVWMEFMTHGVSTYAAVIERNVEQAQFLARLIEQHPRLELGAPVPLNIVCFRYVPADLSPQTLDALNEELLIQLQTSGTAMLSSTRLKERFMLRCAITNHRSQNADFIMLIEEVSAIGQALHAGIRSTPM